MFLENINMKSYDNIVKLRFRTQVRSRSGPEGPRTKDQRPGPGLTLNLVCHHPLTTHSPPPVNFSSGDNTPNHYCMTSNHVSLISAFKMTFRMTSRMIQDDIQDDI